MRSTGKKKFLLGVAAAMFMTATVVADDVTSMKQELADLRAKLASMESTQASECATCGPVSCGCGEPSMEGEAKNLTSMKKKGVITIGGGAETFAFVVHRDEDPRNIHGEDDVIDSTTVSGEADLKFKVAASKDTYLNIKLDLEDFSDADVDQDDLLEELYFVWKNVMGSDLQLAFGKKEVKAFGQDETVGYFDGLVHGGADLLDWGEEADSSKSEYNPANLHDGVGTNHLPGELDNVFQLEATYKFADMAKFMVAVFQDKKGRGMHEDRSDDHGLQSGAAKLVLTPVEGFEFEVSGISRHNDSKGDKDLSGSRAEDDESAISVGFNYEFCGLPLYVFGEYLHGWDQKWTEDMDTDTVQLGMVYGLTECVDFGLMGEWAQIDEGKNYEEEDYYNLYATMYYNFENGISVGLEYCHQWFDGDLYAGGDHEAEAQAIGFVTSWSF
jgi:hypothetical protein